MIQHVHCCKTDSYWQRHKKSAFRESKTIEHFLIRHFDYCLEHAGLTITDVDCIAYYEDPELKLGRYGMVGAISFSSGAADATCWDCK